MDGAPVTGPKALRPSNGVGGLSPPALARLPIGRELPQPRRNPAWRSLPSISQVYIGSLTLAVLRAGAALAMVAQRHPRSAQSLAHTRDRLSARSVHAPPVGPCDAQPCPVAAMAHERLFSIGACLYLIEVRAADCGMAFPRGDHCTVVGT